MNNKEITRQGFTSLCNKKGWEFKKITPRYSNLNDVLESISNGNYIYASNYKRMCENHNWKYNISEYNNAVIKGLKSGKLKKEDIHDWKSLYESAIM